MDLEVLRSCRLSRGQRSDAPRGGNESRPIRSPPGSVSPARGRHRTEAGALPAVEARSSPPGRSPVPWLSLPGNKLNAQKGSSRPPNPAPGGLLCSAGTPPPAVHRVPVAAIQVGVDEIGVRLGKRGLQLDGPPVVPDRRGIVLQPVVAYAQVLMGFRKLRLRARSLPAGPESRRRISAAGGWPRRGWSRR